MSGVRVRVRVSVRVRDRVRVCVRIRVCVGELKLKGFNFTYCNQTASKRVPYCYFLSLPPRAGSGKDARRLPYLDLVDLY